MPSVVTSGRLSLALSATSLLLATVTILNSGVHVKITKNTPTQAIANEKMLEVKSSSGTGLGVTGSGSVTASGQILSQKTTNIGWTVKAGENTACNTTCTFACVVGQTLHTGTGLVLCSDATADQCVCAGPS